MKILYAGLYDYQFKNAAVQRVDTNTRLLQSIGCEVVHVSNGSGVNGEILSDQCVHYYFPVKRSRIFNKYAKTIVRTIELEKIDAVILYNFISSAMFSVMNYGKKHGVRILADSTEWYKYYTLKDVLTKSINVSIRMRLLQKHVDELMVISHNMHDYYYKHNVRSEVIPPLTDYSSPIWQLDENCIITETLSMVSITTAGKHKDDISSVVRLLTECKKRKASISFTLYIVGITEDDYYRHFDSNKIDDCLKSCFVFCGRLPREKIIDMTKKAWFTIFLRENNRANNAGFPSKFVESIACGTPVVSNNTSSIEDYIDEPRLGFILPNETEEQIEKMISILELNYVAVQDLHSNCRMDRTFDMNQYKLSFKRMLGMKVNDEKDY